MAPLVCLCVYSVCSVACVSTDQGEGALAALCTRPLAPWINADCLGMTWSSGPHKESEGERRLAWSCRRGRQRGVHGEFLASDCPLSLFPSFSFFLYRTYFLSPSLSITLNLCFLFHSPFENQWAALVPLLSWGQDETPFPWRQPLPALPNAFVCVCVSVSASASECTSAAFCGRSKAQCGRTLREGYEEDNNPSKNTDAGFN